MRPFVAFAMGLGLLADSAGAQQSVTQPDPATVEVPSITGGRDPDVVKDGWKYFYFWRPNTSFEQAYADFADCYRFLPVPGGDAMLPRFVPWRQAEARRAAVPNSYTAYGLMGAAIGALIAGPIERRASQSRMRRCLEPRGYQRFPAPQPVWEKILDGYSQPSIAVQAKLASGRHPDADPLPETR
jgi:hypothetical protein